MRDRPTSVYMLRDPRCNSVRYVGIAVWPPNRYLDHLYSPSAAIKDWIGELRSFGLKPIMEIVEGCDDRDEAEDLERLTIAMREAEGADLLNVARYRRRHSILESLEAQEA